MAAGAWFDSWRSLIEAVGPPTRPGWLARLNQLSAERQLTTARGQAVRFIAADHIDTLTVAQRELPYETLIADHGLVPTRLSGEDAWHDYFNALAWLRFPQTKAAINQRQAQSIAELGVSGQRGAIRDALTLFDESGVLFVSAGDAAANALRAFDWQALFVEQRARFATQTHCVVFGHALLQKLLRPYKSICGQALILARGGDAALDCSAAKLLLDANFSKRSLTPLPILGIPDWWPANAEPAFYNDPTVFRRGRR